MKLSRCLAIFALLAASFPAHAGVMTVSSPNINEGEISAELGNGWQEGGAGTYEHEFEIGFSPLAYWKTELEFGAERSGGGNLEYAETTWKNTMRFLTQDEKMPVTAAFRLDYGHVSLDGEADEVVGWLLARHKRDAWAATINAGLSKEIGDHASGGLGGELKAKVAYDLTDRIHPAIEYFGNFGYFSDMPDFDEQSHRIGPAVSFDLTEQVGLEIGYAAGITDASPDHSVKFNVEFSF